MYIFFSLLDVRDDVDNMTDVDNANLGIVLDSVDTTSESEGSLSDDPSNISESYDRIRASELVHDLRQIAAECNLTIDAMNRILRMLQKYFKDLPSDARTILKCNSIIQRQRCFSGGSFVYFGLNYALHMCLKYQDNLECDILELYFNIDGIPLTKSSHMQFWPLLVKISGSSQPFPEAIFCGNSKPNFEDFFSDFIANVNNVISYGFSFNQKLYAVRVKGFLCDAPAKASVKNVKPFNAYNGCDYCITKGSYEGRVVFDELDAPLRTDNNFNSYEEHKLGESPLKQIKGIKMITNFPLDYMHLVALGVVRKLIHLWMSGPLKVRIGATAVTVVSEKLLQLAAFFPTNFARKPRSLRCVGLWKASEFKAFLLYTGPLVLKGVISNALYNHFMKLSIAIRLLSSARHFKKHRNLCGILLRDFVRDIPILYDRSVMTYNVHCLIHLSDQTEYHGFLDRFSCFDFESYLGYLKHILRSHKNYLSEITNKLTLKNSFDIQKDKEIKFLLRHNDGPLDKLLGIQYRAVIYKGIRFSTYFYNCKDCCVFDDRSVYLIYNIVVDHEKECSLLCIKFRKMSPFFSRPIDSKEMSIFDVSDCGSRYDIIPLKSLTSKGVLLPFQSSYIFLPVVNTFEK